MLCLGNGGECVCVGGCVRVLTLIHVCEEVGMCARAAALVQPPVYLRTATLANAFLCLYKYIRVCVFVRLSVSSSVLSGA